MLRAFTNLNLSKYKVIRIMLKRLLVLITVSMLLLTYVPESSSANGKDSVFLEGSLLYNLELFEVYCPYELLACDDYLYLFDSDRSCYKLDKQSREILEVFTLSGCSHMPVNLDEDKVSCMEYDAANEVLIIVFPGRIDVIEIGSALLKTRIQLDHCLDVSICENCIYALCPGSSANPDQPNHSCIHVFDLEGNALKTYFLDTTIRRFCITEKEGVLYGLTLEEELPIVKFEL